MKKYYIFVVFLFMFFRMEVYAKTYYGDYYYVGLEELEESDEIKKEEVKLYNTYKIEKRDMNYIDDNPLYIKDLNDYIEVEYYSELNNIDNEELIVIGIEKVNVNSILIKNVELSTGIGEIKIFNKDKEIDYTYESSYFMNADQIKDNNIDTYGVLSFFDSYVNINLGEEVNIYDLKIIIYSKGNQNNYKLKFVVNNSETLIKMNLNREHTIMFDNDNKVKFLYKDKKILYKHYKEEKVAENIYVKSGNNLIYDDYKIINEYYKRDKLILSDEDTINNMYKNVLDFIEYSNGDVEVICDINYEISGEYDCLYKLNDIEVIKNIKVIKEKSNINIKEEKENISINKEEIRNNYIDKITIDENVSELVKIQKQNNIENKENDDNKYKLLIIKYVFFLFFICLEIILYIKRKKRKKRIVESI